MPAQHYSQQVEFAHVCHHQVRNLVTVILSYTSFKFSMSTEWTDRCSIYYIGWIFYPFVYANILVTCSYLQSTKYEIFTHFERNNLD
jgi:hypothetical protein